MVSGISNLDLAETYNYVRDISRQQNDAARSAATGRRVNSLTDDVAAYSRSERLTGDAQQRRRYVSELKGLIPQFRNPSEALSQARDALVQAQTLADSNTAATPAQVNQYTALRQQVDDAVRLAAISGFGTGSTGNVVRAVATTNIEVLTLKLGGRDVELEIDGSGLTGGAITAGLLDGVAVAGSTNVDFTTAAHVEARATLLENIDNSIARLNGFISRVESISTILTEQAGTLEGAAEDLVAADPQEASLRLERLRVQREFANGVFGTLNRSTAGALRFYS